MWFSLEKGECVNLNHSLGCLALLYMSLVGLLGGVCNFGLRICYPCSFYFYALMLVALWDCKLPPGNDSKKD